VINVTKRAITPNKYPKKVAFVLLFHNSVLKLFAILFPLKNKAKEEKSIKTIPREIKTISII
jgi:hypothetical protein